MLTDFQNQIWRKITLCFLGAMNSEILFSNMTPLEFIFDPVTWVLYGLAFLALDEYVQKRNLDFISMLYLGAFFGTALEMLTGSISEDGGFSLIYAATFWHGAITTAATFVLVEEFFPRIPGKPENPQTYRIAKVGLTLSGTALALTSVWAAIGTWPLYLIGGVAMVGEKKLIEHRIKNKRVYHHQPYLAIGILILGFLMGNINREDPDFDHYTTQDRTARSILYGLIGIVTISHIMRRQKNMLLSPLTKKQ